MIELEARPEVRVGGAGVQYLTAGGAMPLHHFADQIETDHAFAGLFAQHRVGARADAAHAEDEHGRGTRIDFLFFRQALRVLEAYQQRARPGI